MRIHNFCKIFTFVFFLFYFGCSTLSKTRTVITDIDSKPKGPVKSEAKLKTFPAAMDQETARYIRIIGRQIQSNSGMKFEVNLKLVEDTEANIFIANKTEILVTVPLLAMMNNESELAGFIAHEFAHLKNRGLNYNLDDSTPDLPVTICKEEDSDCKLRVSTYISAVQATADGSQESLVDSEFDEETAIQDSFLILSKVGYDCTKFAQLLMKLTEDSHRPSPGILNPDQWKHLMVKSHFQKENARNILESIPMPLRSCKGHQNSKQFIAARKWSKKWAADHKIISSN